MRSLPTYVLEARLWDLKSGPGVYNVRVRAGGPSGDSLRYSTYGRLAIGGAFTWRKV